MKREEMRAKLLRAIYEHELRFIDGRANGIETVEQILSILSDSEGSGDSIRIGDFRLSTLSPNKIWIHDLEHGDGGEFETSKLERIISEFYEKNF